MAILVASEKTYEFSLDSMKELIASDLNVEVNKIKVEYVMQSIDNDYRGGNDVKEVTKIKVTVDTK